MSNTFEPLNKSDSTIQDAGLCQGQVLVIEQKNEGGTWPGGHGLSPQVHPIFHLYQRSLIQLYQIIITTSTTEIVTRYTHYSIIVKY